MKLISRFIFCCLTFSTGCYASHTEPNKGSWPIATALGFNKTNTSTTSNTLSQNDSGEWTHINPTDILEPNSTNKKTPSPDIICIGLTGNEEPTPPTTLQAARKMSDELQTDILIAATKLPELPQTISTDLRHEIPAAKGLSLSVPSAKNSPKKPTTDDITPDAPRSSSSTCSMTPPTPASIALSYDEGINRLAAKTDFHPQPNPMHISDLMDPTSSEISYQNPPAARQPLQIDRNNSKTEQPSIIASAVLACCPCLHFWQNLQDAKKKSNG